MESLLNIYHYNMTSIIFTVMLTINVYLTEIQHDYALRTYFYERYRGSRALRTMGKCTSRHLFSNGGFQRVTVSNKILRRCQYSSGSDVSVHLLSYSSQWRRKAMLNIIFSSYQLRKPAKYLQHEIYGPFSKLFHKSHGCEHNSNHLI